MISKYNCHVSKPSTIQTLIEQLFSARGAQRAVSRNVLRLVRYKIFARSLTLYRICIHIVKERDDVIDVEIAQVQRTLVGSY